MSENARMRTASGQPPLGIGGLAFRDDQGEWLEHDNPRYRSPATRIGVLALDGGTWLAHPPGFRIDGRQHASREAALRAGIAVMVRRARKNMRAKEGEGTSWTEGYAGRVIDWALSIKPKVETKSPIRTVVGKISGGIGSYLAVKRYVEVNGRGGLQLLFTDTLCEDQDAYRFLIAGAADLMGVSLPGGFIPAIEDFPAWEDRDAYKQFVTALAERARVAIPGFNWISDGRDVWDVYEAERFLGNSRVDPCSKILKRELADRWLAKNCISGATKIIVGIDYEERERFFGRPRSKGILALWAERGWTALAPLCDEPLLSWKQRVDAVERAGLWLPRLNAFGFAHNNCGGFCCKGGIGHWLLMLKRFPERYAYSEARENALRLQLGDVSMLTDRRGGTKKPLPLQSLRSREPTAVEAADLGACNCYLPTVGGGDEADGLDQQTYAAIDAGATISDPVVAALVEAHSLRKQFPAAHTFSMTTEVADGRIVSVATCKCGQAIRFGSNDYVRMNAAIEAHWRRYPDGAMVDGRGDPILPGDGARIAGSKPRKRRKPAKSNTETQSADEHNPVALSGAGQGDASSASEAHLADQLAPVDPAADKGAEGDDPPHAPPAVLSEAAPIGAGEKAPKPEDWTWNLASDPATNRIHTVRMATEDGMHIATCQCEWTFMVEACFEGKERRDAAVKAHWQQISDAVPKPARRSRRKNAEVAAPLVEADLLYEIGAFYVIQTVKGGYEVYRNGLTHSTRCARIGFEGNRGLARAIQEADRRHASTLDRGQPCAAPAQAVVTEPASDWSPLLLAATELAWSDDDDPKPKRAQANAPAELDGRLLGHDDRARVLVALKGEPIDGGPLFGELPPPSTSRV